jgi:hypothetical protein
MIAALTAKALLAIFRSSCFHVVSTAGVDASCVELSHVVSLSL